MREAVKATQAAMGDHRVEQNRLQADLKKLDDEIAKLVQLLADRALPDVARPAVMRQIGEKEQERNRLLARSRELGDRAGRTAEELVLEVRAALVEIRASLAAAATPEGLNELLVRVVGPMVVGADGVVRRKTTAPGDSGAVVQGLIAGAGFESSPNPAEKPSSSPIPGTQSGTVDARGSVDTELRTLIDRWNQIPEAMRAGIMAMIRASTEPK